MFLRFESGFLRIVPRRAGGVFLDNPEDNLIFAQLTSDK
jgi:hypothetical protein